MIERNILLPKSKNKNKEMKKRQLKKKSREETVSTKEKDGRTNLEYLKND